MELKLLYYPATKQFALIIPDAMILGPGDTRFMSEKNALILTKADAKTLADYIYSKLCLSPQCPRCKNSPLEKGVA